MDPLEKLLQNAGYPPGSNPARQMIVFLGLLRKWNARVNLTASAEWPAVGPLFEEAIWAAGLYRPEAGAHLDIGSGAGFPALLLRILLPRLSLDLVESRSKRCQFLETAISELELKNVRVANQRLDAFLSAHDGAWDCISWKAVKLSPVDIRMLAGRGTERTRFWMFHGAAPAVMDSASLERELALERREAFPAREGWWLSIYRVKRGSGAD